jgi:hypothetical protein
MLPAPGAAIGEETAKPSAGLMPDSSHVFSPYLRWEEGFTRLESIGIADAEFIWVEDDNNSCNGSLPRWEGVINFRSAFFPTNVGGCFLVKAPLNRRHEVLRDNQAPVELYYSSFDGKLHLKGARHSYMNVDYNQDGVIDMAYRYEDRDGDGYQDRTRLDVNNDGTFDLVLDTPKAVIPWNGYADWDRLRALYQEHAPLQGRRSDALLPVLRSCVRKLRSQPDYVDAAEAYFKSGLASFGSGPAFGPRLVQSAITKRFYDEVARDRYFVHLQTLLPTAARAVALDHYGRGEDASLVTHLTTACGL